MSNRRFGGRTEALPIYRGAIPGGVQTQKTVLVVGQPRGGTSVVAGVLDALGVYMGEPEELRSGGSFEDYTLVHGSDAERLAEMDRRNAEYHVWGWKQPFGVATLDTVPVTVRNLHCVFVFRDLVALAHAYQHHNRISGTQALKFAKEQNDALWRRAMETEHPSVLFSYERIRAAPAVFVKDVDGFLGLGATHAQLAEAVARVSPSGGYVTMPESFGGPSPAPLPRKWQRHGDSMPFDKQKEGADEPA